MVDGTSYTAECAYLDAFRLSHAVDDAVYLDEDAYNQVQPKVAYLKTIQVLIGRVSCS